LDLPAPAGRQGIEAGVEGEHGRYVVVALVDGEEIFRILTFLDGRVPERATRRSPSS